MKKIIVVLFIIGALFSSSGCAGAKWKKIADVYKAEIAELNGDWFKSLSTDQQLTWRMHLTGSNSSAIVNTQIQKNK